MLRMLFVLMLSLWSSVAMAAAGDTLAVIYFKNEGNPELAPLRVGLAQMLITDLQPTEGLTVVERQEVQAILDELQLGHDGYVDKDTAVKIGKLIGARYILMGGYFELVGTLRIDARLVEVETGKIVHAHGVNGAATGFLELEKDLAADLTAHFTGTTKAVQPSEPAGKGAGTTPKRRTRGEDAPAGETKLVEHDGDTVKAALAYSEGLMFLDKKDSARARESFQTAVAADPALEAARAELAALDL